MLNHFYFVIKVDSLVYKKVTGADQDVELKIVPYNNSKVCYVNNFYHGGQFEKQDDNLITNAFLHSFIYYLTFGAY